MDVLCPLSMFHSINHFCALGGSGDVHHMLLGVLMVDDSIYRGLSLVGNLRTSARLGLGIIILYVGLMT